jgi:hypothetical protein
LYPFDAIVFEAVVALNQASSRLFAVPSSLGIECRILNGYAYVTANSVTDARPDPRRHHRADHGHALGNHTRAHPGVAHVRGRRSAELRGVACSPGVVEGLARVMLDAAGADQLQKGEILVAPTTSTSWTPVFATIAAAVLDTGGIMSG